MVAETSRPTPDMVRAGFKSNDKGAGFAWRDVLTPKKGEKGTTPTPIVRWKKALTDLDEIVDMSEKLPIPYVLHCRIPSIGGPNLDLTHPFPVSKAVSLDHEGWTTGEVLFHNGTWREWDDESIKAALLRGIKLPRGPFSDSRMMAWVYHLIGPGFLDMIGEKVIIFGPEGDPEIFGQNYGWTCVNDIWCSNDGFKRHLNTPRREEHKRSESTTIMGPHRAVGSHGGHGGDRQILTGFRAGPSSVGVPGPNDRPEDFDLQEGDEEATQGLRNRIAAGIVAAVERIGDARKPSQARHPLIEDDGFRREYQRLHGHAPPFKAAGWSRGANVIGNPKRFRSNGLPGDADLALRREQADRGITRVL